MGCCGKHTTAKPGVLTPVPGLPTVTGEIQCLECVEKHVGESVAEIERLVGEGWIVAGETMDGYPGRLKIIGNLALAEKHARAWPAIHDALRDARKAYQNPPHAMPDWPAIEAIINALRRKESMP